MPNIALVDDDRNILTSVKIILEAEGFTVQTYSDGVQALRALASKLPDLILLDIKMPHLNGHEVLEELRHFSDLPVIFLTSKKDEADQVLGLTSGADDYICKPFSTKILLARIRAVLRRRDPSEENSNPRKTLTESHLEMDVVQHLVKWKGAKVVLTATEFQLFHALAQRPGFVKSRDQLMDIIYQDQDFFDDRSIDSHIKRLRQKMRRVDPTFCAIETLYGLGYRYNEPE